MNEKELQQFMQHIENLESKAKEGDKKIQDIKNSVDPLLRPNKIEFQAKFAFVAIQFDIGIN